MGPPSTRGDVHRRDLPVSLTPRASRIGRSPGRSQPSASSRPPGKGSPTSARSSSPKTRRVSSCSRRPRSMSSGRRPGTPAWTRIASCGPTVENIWRGLEPGAAEAATLARNEDRLTERPTLGIPPSCQKPYADLLQLAALRGDSVARKDRANSRQLLASEHPTRGVEPTMRVEPPSSGDERGRRSQGPAPQTATPSRRLKPAYGCSKLTSSRPPIAASLKGSLGLPNILTPTVSRNS